MVAVEQNAYAEASRWEAAFRDAFLLRPSATRRPGRHLIRPMGADAIVRPRNDSEFDGATAWTPGFFVNGTVSSRGHRDLNIVAMPAVWVRLDVEDGPEAVLSVNARCRALGIREPHFCLLDGRQGQLFAIWQIPPFRRPGKNAVEGAHQAWITGLHQWRWCQAKLAVAFQPLGADLEVPTWTESWPSLRDAYVVHASLGDPCWIGEISRAIEDNLPGSKTLARTLVHPKSEAGWKKRAWEGSSTFRAAAEPKVEGERHPAALKMVCRLRWGGAARVEADRRLRQWADNNTDTKGFPEIRAKGDEISALIDWAWEKLKPLTRAADVRGKYERKADLVWAVLDFLRVSANGAPWEGTQAELCDAVTVHAGVAVSERSLRATMKELLELGLVKDVVRRGRTWMTLWSLRSGTGAALGAIREPKGPVFSSHPSPGKPPYSPKKPQGGLITESAENTEDEAIQPIESGTDREGRPHELIDCLTDPKRFVLENRGKTPQISLFLLKPNSKVPHRDWADAQTSRSSCTDLADALGKHPNANLAIACGPASGLVVVDIDSVSALWWARANLPATSLQVKTQRGEHWYYLHPPYPVSSRSKSPDFPVEVKALGTYVVAPGSRHPGGHRYELNDEGLDENFSVENIPEFDPRWFGTKPRAPTTKPDFETVRELKGALKSKTAHRVRTIVRVAPDARPTANESGPGFLEKMAELFKHAAKTSKSAAPKSAPSNNRSSKNPPSKNPPSKNAPAENPRPQRALDRRPAERAAEPSTPPRPLTKQQYFLVRQLVEQRSLSAVRREARRLFHEFGGDRDVVNEAWMRHLRSANYRYHNTPDPGDRLRSLGFALLWSAANRWLGETDLEGLEAHKPNIDDVELRPRR